MNVLYFDCFSGASGDMILGALIDAGVPAQVIRESVASLHIPGWSMEVREVRKAGLRATKVDVRLDDKDAPARGIREITALIEAAGLTDGVQDRALRTFGLLAEAEGRAHGIPASEVHFHEVGAVDAIVDVVGASAAIEHLQPELVVTSAIATGRGFVESAHGRIPIPGPAVVELLRGAQLTEQGDEELLTPTGAAILAAATDRFDRMPDMRLRSSGYGAGTKDRVTPNVLRVLLGEVEVDALDEGSVLVETNIDDMSPELIPYAIERLLAAGAADAWVTPIVMKKGRSAVTLSVLVEKIRTDSILDTIYRETTTLGVRIRATHKDELERDSTPVEVAGHMIRVKVGVRRGRVVTASPEYEDARKVAQISGMPLKDVYREALARFSLASRRGDAFADPADEDS